MLPHAVAYPPLDRIRSTEEFPRAPLAMSDFLDISTGDRDQVKRLRSVSITDWIHPEHRFRLLCRQMMDLADTATQTRPNSKHLHRFHSGALGIDRPNQ